MTKKFTKFLGEWRLLIGFLASIVFVFSGLFVFFPWMITRTQNWFIIILSIFVLIPAFPVVSGILQGKGRSITGLVNEYFNEFIALFFEILYLLLMMPIIGLGIAAATGIMLVVATFLGTAMWFLQEGLGIQMGVSITGEEGWYFLGIAGIISVAEVAFWTAAHFLGKANIEDRFIDGFFSVQQKCHDFVDSNFSRS